MQTQAWTATSIKAHQSDLKQRIHQLIPLKNSVLVEAHPRGLGFRTQAALLAALKSTPELSARTFNKADFVARIAELSDDTSAEVIEEILEGATLDISVIKCSEPHQGSDRFSGVAYDVVVTLGGILPAALHSNILFHLPEYGRAAEAEPYRVDSAHDRRAATDYRKTRSGAAGTTLVAKLVDGHWHGGLYVYAQEHQADDTRCVKSLKAGLARAILPQLPTRVRCSIFTPDGYQKGAWRVEMRLPPDVLRYWNGSPFQFDIPQLNKRMFKMQSGFWFDTDVGQFMDGVWKADLYSNGIEEARNPTSLAEVKHTLLESVNQLVARAGYGDDGMPMAVIDVAGKTVGTVQFRNGSWEAWKRARTVERPGNVHKLLGCFGKREEASAAVRASF